jgi:septal ring factor EnvC (AmiA/AmiB activator)
MPPPINNPSDDAQKQTEQLKKNMADLNSVLLQLAKTQEELGKTIEKNSGKFGDLAQSLDDAARSIKEFNKQIGDTAKTIDVSKKSIEENKKAVASLEQVYDTLQKSHRVSSKQLAVLREDIDLLTQNIQDQEKAIAASAKAFDFQKGSIDQLKSAFDKLKTSNKDFGPVLEDVTKGFNMMKDGLDVVKTGFTGVGAAIKATGFGLLVLVLQSVTEYFTKTTEGAKKLKGGIAAISLVIKTVKETVSKILSAIGKDIADAVSHPAETVKKVWNAVIENITNRFKGISVFFKGLFSGDLKGMSDGLIQMGTGITNGTTKIKTAFNTLKTDISKAGTAIVKAYSDGANASDKAAEKITKNNKRIAKELEKGGKQKRVISPQLEAAHSIDFNGSQPVTNSDDFDDNSDQNVKKIASANIEKQSTSEDGMIHAHNSGDWKTEFALRQQQLDAEKIQAEQSAKDKNQSVLKVDQEYKEKQRQLDKAKLDAQFANQQNYLKSVDKLSGALTGIFGKNTIAAKAAFKAHQAAAAGQVIIDTQKSIMGIWSANASIPFIGVPKAIAETAIAVAAGASSLAGIVKQKPGFAQGGYYASDGRGALLSGYSRTDDTNAYLRSGEAVVVSEAMRNPWARNLVSAINVAHGGRDFSTANPGKGYAIGGIFTDGGNANRYYSQPANDVKDLANTLAYQMLNNFPPIYVDVKDVNNQQNILAQTVNRVNL